MNIGTYQMPATARKSMNPKKISFASSTRQSFCHTKKIRMIIKEYVNNQTLNYRDDWRDNMMILRYDAEVIVESQA